MDTDGERNHKKKVSKWKCKLCAFENLRKAKVCKNCNKDKVTTADGHQSDESCRDAADQTSTTLRSNPNIELLESPTNLSDVEAIINRLENEIKQQYENVKSAIKTKQPHDKKITKSKQQIIEQLDEASRLLSKQSDELSTKSPTLEGTIVKQKRRGLQAEREKQWAAIEENLNEEFKEKRQQELIEIEMEWTEKWKREMEEKWTTIESYIKADLPEIEMDTRKKQFVNNFMGELKLKLEGMKILWETRNNTEWTAHRLIRKFQWDNESGQLWAVEKLNYIKEYKDEVVSKTDTGLNTYSKQVNQILEICKTQIENIFKMSKSITKNTENTLQTTEKHMNKLVEGFKELNNMMTISSTTMQQQDKDNLKTLKSENEDLKKTFMAAIKEMENTKLMMIEERQTNKEELAKMLDETEHVREKFISENRELNQKLKVAIEEQEKIRKGQQGELQSVELKWKHEQESWESQREQLINKQSDFNQVIVEMKLKYEANSKEWQDRCEALISSECQLNRLNEKLNKDSDGNINIGSTSKVTYKKGANKKSIETYHDNAFKTWKCEHCTLDNPPDGYICYVCGKVNDKQRRRIISEIGDVGDHKRPPPKLSARRLTKFEQRSDIQGKSVPNNKQTEMNDMEPNVEGYSDDEDPFEKLGNPGRRSYSEAIPTDQFGGDIQNKQSISRSDKSHDDYSGEESNQIKHQKTVTHWTCEHCTLDNPLSQSICQTCGRTNDQLRPTIGNETGADQDDVMKYNDDNRDKSSEWSCEHCTTYNPLNQYICEGCSKTNTERKASIGNEKGAVQKHNHQTNKSSKNYATASQVPDYRNDYVTGREQFDRPDNSYMLITGEKINKDVHMATIANPQDTTQEQPLLFFQRSINYLSNVLNLGNVYRSSDHEIREGLQKLMTFMQIPWDSQNDEIKRNYRQLVASRRMESGSQEVETAAILKFIYPETEVDIIIESLRRYNNIEKTIRTITRSLKKK